MFKNVNIMIAGACIGILVFIAIVLIWGAFNSDDKCLNNTYDCRKHQVELCLKDEQFTVDQCIRLLVGK